MRSEVEQHAWYAARSERMYVMRTGGATFQQVADEFSLSRERVRQCVFKHKSLLAEIAEGNTLVRGEMVYTTLGVRTRNCLFSLGIKDLVHLREWTERELLRCPNFGKKSLDELKLACAMVNITIGWNRSDTEIRKDHIIPAYAYSL